LAVSDSESSLPLIFGIVDGLDGKQSRVKIEMTERGKWEHYLDYLIENFVVGGYRFSFVAKRPISERVLFFRSARRIAAMDEFAKRRAKMAKGRLLDDVTPFDRAFRLIAARRNVYVWIWRVVFC